jgi:uncharacterized protein YbbK (DUF523 family)
VKLVSACLIGMCTTFRGGANARNVFEELVAAGKAVPFCPEQLGGLPTPRPPAEIVGGTGEDVLDGRARVVTSDGADVTENYLRGAHETLRLAQLVGADEVILKERSPSCGVERVHDGTFSGTTIPGSGVTTALLRRHGFKVTSDEDY